MQREAIDEETRNGLWSVLWNTREMKAVCDMPIRKAHIQYLKPRRDS